MCDAMQEIDYRNAVRFKIPSNWKTEDEPGVQGTFYEDRPDSGTLRVSVLQFAGRDTSRLEEVLASAVTKPKITKIQDGLSLHVEIEPGMEAGEKLSLHRWLVAVPLGPEKFRLVIFTHTIVEGQEATDPRIGKELKLIDDSVRQATYSRTVDLPLVDR